jgi:hyaluronan synthase
LSYLYIPFSGNIDRKYQPTISFGVPAKNEGENIRETILRIAAVQYPSDKFDIIAINDGSTDNTLAEMHEAAKIAKAKGFNVRITNWKVNRGKRDGMAECVRQSKADILIFIDSDSFIDPGIAQAFVKYFIDPRVGAVAGHAYVANAEKNILTKMQSVRYYIAFKAYKAAEALFGSVTCCSGCCSAYRRSSILPIMKPWLNQYFLGVRCTYGDDRSLTNLLLKDGYKTLFAPEAIAYTFVPETLRQFTKQQLRWKKSWVRENLIAATFMWRKNIIMSISFYLGVILPLVSPIIIFRAFVIYPYQTHNFPLFYVLGILLMAFLYGFYYQIYTHDRKWIYGVMFASLSTIILIWQLPYAILNLRDARWGTR